METDTFFSVPENQPKQQGASAPVPTETALESNGVTGQAATIAASDPSPAETPARAFSLEEANEEIALLLVSGKVTQKEVSALQGMMRDHVALREKVSKLKSLLGRSAKAQREAKMELEGTQKRLEQALREVDKLNQKCERLANRPSHMDLLADFETNFDKALLSVGQSGGQDTAAPTGTHPSSVTAASSPAAPTFQQEAVVDSMLMQELAESQSRIERLENLNSALVQRSAQLESLTKQLQQEKNNAQQSLSRAQLELKMAQMEAEHASRAVQDKMASLQEMQLEIELVTRASMDANVRAQKGEAAAKTVESDREMVQQLQAQVQALQEWALASAEAKRLSLERVKILELKLEAFQGGTAARRSVSGERKFFTKTSSLVVGAGMLGFTVVEIGEHAKELKAGEQFVLRWKFDVTPETLGVNFCIIKGRVDPNNVTHPDYLVQDRVVTGGAGGEQEAAFVVQNACTMVWSNKKSWVRPRTIKFVVDVIGVKDVHHH